jgi:uncharacterized protein
MAGRAELRETHTAWVLLAGDAALKIKKPVRLAFVDYSTLERRLEACRHEVEINAPLAPGLYRGVRPLLPGGRLGPFGPHPDAVEYAVEMRRFDEGATMAALLDAGRLTAGQVDAVAARIARFHAEAGPLPGGGAAPWLERAGLDLDELGADAPRRRFLDGVARRLGGELDARAREGLHRDGHGDLRADHVLFEEPLLIVDRLEFDPALRAGDVAADLAFLAMDLEARGGAWAAERLVAAYAQAGGRVASTRLFAALEWQRALVRIKTSRLSGDAAGAGRHEALADRLEWRSRAPRVLLVGGPPASGKSTLAGAVAERAGLPWLRSDVVRKELAGIEATTRAGAVAYAAEMTERTYRELGRRAAACLGEAPGVVVDATFRTRASRAAVLEALGEPAVFALCEAPVAVLERRARERAAAGGDVSDADAVVAARLAAEYEAPDELGDAVCRLRTDRPVEEILAALAAWLDDDDTPPAPYGRGRPCAQPYA